MYKKRYLEQQIPKLSQTFPVVLLTGARQVGKTTLLEHLNKRFAGRYNYVSLDEFEIRTLAKRDPALFLQQYPTPLIIDEVQYAPEIFSYLKAEVDRKKTMGNYWLTGSQHFLMMKNVSESLAGRVVILRLLGLSLAEEKEIVFDKNPWAPDRINSKSKYPSLSLLEIFKTIIRGSFPRLLHHSKPPLDAFYGSYVQTYIDRDLRDLVKTSSLANFEKFIRLCAAHTATLLNLSDLARDSDISVNTAKEWLSLLEASGQVFLLRPYYKNISKRLIKTPKLYFLDTGLVCYLLGWRDPIATSRGAFAGALFETFVLGEILKSYWHRAKEPRIFYFRTKEKTEVDILIEKNGQLLPVEIKLSSIISPNDLKGIYHLQKTAMAIGKGAVIAPVRHIYALQKDLIVVPPTVIK